MVYYTKIAFSPFTTFSRGKGFALMKKFPWRTRYERAKTLEDPWRNTPFYLNRVLKFTKDTLKISIDCRYEDVLLVTYFDEKTLLLRDEWIKNYYLTDKDRKELADFDDKWIMNELADHIPSSNRVKT